VATEIERACDNLIKSGKGFGPANRRDSMPMGMGRPGFTDFGMLPLPPGDAKRSFG
jgi:hypothetical protein